MGEALIFSESVRGGEKNGGACRTSLQEEQAGLCGPDSLLRESLVPHLLSYGHGTLRSPLGQTPRGPADDGLGLVARQVPQSLLFAITREGSVCIEPVLCYSQSWGPCFDY